MTDMDNQTINQREVDTSYYVRKALREWKFILKVCVIAAVVGVVMAMSAVSTYTSKVVVAPEITQRASSSSLSSLANMAGINLRNMISTTDAMHPDIYPEIVKSVPFITDLFEVPVEFTREGETISTTYFDYLSEYSRAPWYAFVLSLPARAVGAVAGLFSPDKDVEEGEDEKLEVDTSNLTRKQSAVAKRISKRINVVFDNKTCLINMSVTDQDPKIACQIARCIVENLEKYVVSYRTEKARHDLAYYEQLYADARDDYFDAQQNYARYVDSNHGIVRQAVLVERERLQNEANLKYKLYNSVAQELQQAQAKVQLETPVCAVLQPPTAAHHDNESGFKTLVIWIFLGLFVAVFWVLYGRGLWKRIKSGDILKEPEDREPIDIM